ncbi:protein-L-isoaspartate O-methyltransferase [Devosia algicola]|uniref:Protein-L-isoaspartate O-methyltransferase n=1 Tax=Devosia algicola TaxID=3026418 RepID=A0ABY7YPX6_9HYPH|nr:protein-L-isoaspartate O-methyltransferase [Devosia algicola]WDR03366.1 protein-L-isoaspartate O-methyltransferase [Devosia algicola]
MDELIKARKHMVDNQLRTSGITDWRILAVMSSIPRENFVPESHRVVAYSDKYLPVTIGNGPTRYLGAAAPFAKLVQLADVGPSDTVLDVGAATGYSTAVLAGLAASVTGLEIDPAMVTAANVHLSALGIDNAKVVPGPLADGVKGQYSVIVVEGMVASVPEPLLDQLADGGRLVALIANGGPAVAHIFVRTGNEVAGRAEFNANLPPLPLEPQALAFEF